MFIIFVIFLTTVFVHSHGKYIDLLPEEEKQEFLEQVARRIMQNVESKENKEKFSRELTDEQLKEHDDFVQKILKQESEQRRRKGDDDRSGEEKSSDEHLEVKPLQIESAGSDKVDTPEAEQVDFTFNNIKRRSYDAAPPINATDDVKDNSMAENLPVHKRSIQSEESEHEEATTIKQNVETRTEVNEHIESTKFRDLTVLKTNYTQSTTSKSDTREATTVDPLNHEIVASLESAHQVTTTENSRRSHGFDKSGESVAPLHKNTSTIEDSISSNTTTKSDMTIQAADLKTDSPKDIPTESSITYINMNKRNTPSVDETHTATTDNNKEKTTVSSVLNRSDEENHSTTDAPGKDSDDSTLSSTLSDEGTTEGTTETTTYESDSDLTTDGLETTTESQKHVKTTEKQEEDTENEHYTEKHGKVTEKDEEVTEKNEEVTEKDEEVTEKDEEVAESQEDEDVTENTPLVNSATTENYNTQTENSTVVSKALTITTTDLPIPALTPTDIEYITTKKPRKSKHKLTKIKNADTDTAIGVFSSTMQKVKAKIKKRKPKLKKYRDLHKSNMKQEAQNTYRVYEVHWPASGENESPFLRSPNPMINQPYMVPIYNYAPNNAYYNPRNRLGPNAAETNSIEQDISALRGGRDDDDIHATKPEFILDLDIELMRKFGKYISRPKQYQIMKYASSKYPPKKQKRDIMTTWEESDEDDETSAADGIRLPSEREALHPYNNMKSGLKSQISAIRDVLFHNKHFGTGVGQNDYGEFLHLPKKLRLTDRLLRQRADDDKFIDLDYFFGRAYPRIKPSKVARQKSNLRNVNSAIDEVKMFFINVGDQFQNLIHPNKNVYKKQKNIYKTGVVGYKKSKKDEHKKNDTNVYENGRVDTISKILNITNEADLLINLQKMQDMKMKLMRRNDDAQFGKYVIELREMIAADNKALMQYDWLDTTVQIQSGLAKLLELIQRARESKPIHPADIQILKYVVFLHNFATEIRQANHFGNKLRKKLVLPKSKKKRNRSKVLKEKGLLNRVWLYLRTLLPDLTAEDGLSNVHEFLLGVQDGLFDLHEAVKHVASVTKFNQQHWYENLKDLYLTTEEKQVREVLLHITFARLVGLIEYSCQNGLDDDFIAFMKTHRNIAKTTLEETLFALKIVDEINNNLV